MGTKDDPNTLQSKQTKSEQAPSVPSKDPKKAKPIISDFASI